MRRQRHIRGWAVSVLVSASLAMAALAVDLAHRAEASDLAVQSGELRAEIGVLRTDLEAVTAESGQVLLQIERAKALRGKRAWSGLIALIGSCMPEDCWLSSISTVPERPAAVAAHRVAAAKTVGKQESQGAITIDAPRKLKVTGYASHSAQPHEFVAILKGVGAFTAVSLGSSQRQQVLDGSYYRFELVCEW
ncbi:MAG: PilN domain-containing protein [Planctomycetota bacterium]